MYVYCKTMEKVVRKIGLREKQSDFVFWQQKTVEERLAAIELLRDQYIKYIKKGADPGLQRVCRVVRRS